MEWHYSKNGVQLGPFSREDLLQKKQSGELLPTDLVWQSGMDDWIPFTEVAELSDGASTAAPSSTTGNEPAINIPNRLWQAVAALLFFLPFGVMAIIQAAKVDGFIANGDIAGARAASRSARKWFNLAAVAFLLLLVLVLIGFALGWFLE